MGLLWCLTKMMAWGHVLFFPVLIFGTIAAAMLSGRALDNMGWIRGWVTLIAMMCVLLALSVVLIHHVLVSGRKLDRLSEKGERWLWARMMVGVLSAAIGGFVVFDQVLHWYFLRISGGAFWLVLFITSGCCLWTLFAGVVIGGLKNEHGCVECGYDLRGTVMAGREECPECGEVIGEGVVVNGDVSCEEPQDD